MSVKNLKKAKKGKNDEFYTLLPDIEKEMKHYKDHFKDKVVFCNCDDPIESNFWKYFHLNFAHLGLKRLVATHYHQSEPTYKMVYEGGNDNDCSVGVKTPLSQNGDFRSPECIELLKESDIVVTNPPFSLFREYVAQLIEHDKKFIVLGNMNAVTCKEIFPLIKNNKMWSGFSFNATMEFIMPDSYKLKGKAYIDENGRKHGFVPSICWYTNLDIKKRHEFIDLIEKYDPEKYPKYDNYDVIEVSKTLNIPVDYKEVMGVPISFLSKYCPEQFEILGLTQVGCHDEVPVTKNYDDYLEMRPNGEPTGSKGSKTNGNANLAGNDGKRNYFINLSSGHVIQSNYQRIFIKHKQNQ